MSFDSLISTLKSLNLTGMAQHCVEFAMKAEKEKRPYTEYLHELALQEQSYRTQRRIERLLKAAKLPRDKHLSDFETDRFESFSPSLIKTLATGDFIDHCENVLIFGNPGTGKTHLSIALSREWCLSGRKVFFTTAAALVQSLLKAKQDLELNRFVERMDKFEILVIDDISYIPYEQQETDILFHLLAARYEQRSIVITSNLVFSDWNQIFKDEMTTTAAIDRLVHHATIIELNAESYRAKSAKLKAKNNKE